MLSIEVCRKVLGVSKDELSDEQIENIRYSLYQFSQVITDNYLEVKRNKNECSNLYQSFNRRTS